MPQDVLEIESATLDFGGLRALSNVDMTIEPGLITSVIGPNGAGKTSLLNCISGFYHPTRGEIHYGSRRLTHASPHQVSNLGIARAFQNIELFSGMTVLDNLLLAPFFRQAVGAALPGWRRAVGLAVQLGLPAPAFGSALSFYDGYRCGRLPANLLQAQRDYFGAHSYERVDRPRGEFFHTDWIEGGAGAASSTYQA